MANELLFHLAGLVAAFGAVTLASLAGLRQIVVLGLWPLEPSGSRNYFQELAARLGDRAGERGWFAGLRESAGPDLIRARMVHRTASELVGESMVYALIGGVAGWLVTILVGGAVWNVVPGLVMAGVVFQIPGWRVRTAAQERVKRVTRRLPYSLEVVVLATEAGASLEEALAILVREDGDEPLHEEFDQVLRDMQLGLTRREALHAMADRIGTDDIRSLAMAMDVAEDLGTPVGETLRKQAAAVQSNRLRRAEKLSREAAPKMAVPNTLIMVANVLLILAPFLPKLSAF
ncbi:MAG: type II secretion system F family protein [Vicinamibacterales bacterium]